MCFCGDVFVVVLLWCSCGGVFVVWCSCGGAFGVVW